MCRNMKGRVTQRKKRIQGVSQVKNWTGIWAAAKGARGNFVENNTLASDWLWWYRSLELLRFSQPACVAGKVGGTTGWRLLQWASGQPAAAPHLPLSSPAPQELSGSTESMSTGLRIVALVAT